MQLHNYQNKLGGRVGELIIRNIVITRECVTYYKYIKNTIKDSTELSKTFQFKKGFNRVF